MARIYSVAIPALFTTFALNTVGQAVNGAAYSSIEGFGESGVLSQLLNAVLFTN